MILFVRTTMRPALYSLGIPLRSRKQIVFGDASAGTSLLQVDQMVGRRPAVNGAAVLRC